MSIFRKLLDRHQREDQLRQDEARTPAEQACAHSVLVPRWDRVEDMGREERAIGYMCEACGQTFDLTEGWDLKRMEAERRAQLIDETAEEDSN